MNENLFNIKTSDAPGSSSDSVTYSAANSITTATSTTGQSYTSSTADQNALLVSLASGTVNLTNPTVTKTGDTAGSEDNCNFYGINSGVIAMGGGNLSVTGGTITAGAEGANGIFSYGGNGGQNGVSGDGTTVYISGTTIKTTGDNSGGIMTTGGGKTVAENLTITTTGRSSAPIRTDRGGGDVTVNGGSYTSSGLGSPAIYSTATISVKSATLTSNKSEGVCIEGQNSVTLTDCTLTANNTNTNGNAQFLDAVNLYQSQSGDAADGTSSFVMSGGELINQSGHLFHVTNTAAVVSLSGVTISDTGDGVFISVCDDGWSGASNVATVYASNQTIDGDILVGDNSTLTLNISDSSTFNGKISGTITNNEGTSISTSLGTVNVSLDESSKWYLSEDTYISSFSGTAANVITGDYNLYVDGSILDGTTTSDDDDAITNSTNNTLVTGTNEADTITNSGTNVTVQALGGDDTIANNGESSSIDGGEGNDSIISTGDGVTIDGGSGDNFIYNTGSNVSMLGGDGADTIYNAGDNVSITGGTGDGTILNNGGTGVIIDGGSGDNFIYNSTGDNISISGGAGDDSIANTGNNVSITAGDGNDTIDTFGDSVTVDAGDGNDGMYNEATNTSINGGAGNDTIENYGDSVTITGGDGDDEIGNAGDNVSINAGTGDDYIYNAGSNVTLTGGDGSDIFVYDSGSFLVTDYTAGADTISLANGSLTSATLNNSDVILTIGTNLLTISSGADKTLTILDSSGNDISTIVSATDTTPAETTGLTYDETTRILTADSTFTGTTIDLDNYEKAKNVDASALSTDVNIIGNALANSLLGGAGNDSLDGGKGNDTLYGTNGNDTLTGGDGNDVFVHYSGNDLITDYGNGNDKIFVLSSMEDVVIDDGDVVISFGDGDSLTIADASDEKFTFLLGTAKYYFANHAILNSSKTSADLTSTATTFDAADFSKLVTIDGSAVDNAVKITGNSKANKIFAGDNGSTLNGGAGRDTLTGGDGTDIFLHETTGGSDVIVNYAAGDVISLVGSAVTGVAVKTGGDVVLTIGDDKITVKGASGEEITISEDGTTKYISGGMIYDSTKTSVTVPAKYSSTTAVTFADTVTEIDASSAKRANLTAGNSGTTINGSSGNDTLTGGTGNDSIFGGNGNDKIFGTAGNNTLWGGAGNDTLTGGTGIDKFIYNSGEGKDVIVGFDDTDLLEITDGFTATVKSSGIVLKYGSSSTLTLKNYTATSFNINGDTYAISGKTLVKS